MKNEKLIFLVEIKETGKKKKKEKKTKWTSRTREKEGKRKEKITSLAACSFYHICGDKNCFF